MPTSPADDFFEWFDRWVADVDAVVSTDDDGTPTSSRDDGEHSTEAVELVTAFVLVQRLGAYGVVDAAWLRETWARHERAHRDDGPRATLDAFFTDVEALLGSTAVSGLVTRFASIDVDLSESNAAACYRALEGVLGVATRAGDAKPGVTDVDDAQIHDDVIGRIYERYLADGRAGRGIYYTPSYLSEWVVDDTVGTRFRRIATRLEAAVEAESWDDADAAAAEFTDVTVLDPACGTGSFLVAAYATIRAEYDRLFDVLDAERRSRQSASGGARGESETDALERVDSLLKRLGYSEADDGTLHRRERTLAARIVLRHLHAIDLDQHALDVAKLNLWLEAVERDSAGRAADSRLDEPRIVPALDANLGWGNALVGLSDEAVRRRLRARHGEEMEAIRRARAQYLDDPSDPEPLGGAAALRAQVRGDLDAAFEASLEASGLPTAVLDETRPFYWPLQFWHVLGDGGGFDCVVGNPPWAVEGDEHTKRFLVETYDHQSGQPDLYRYFLERSFAVTTGRLGMVTPNTWLSIPGARQLRRALLCDGRIETVAFVPDSAFDGVGQNSIAVVVETGTDPDDAAADAERPPIRVGDVDPTGTFRALRTVDPADVESPSYHINPYVGSAEKSIIAAMDATTTDLSEIADLTVGYQLYHRSLHTETEIENEVFHAETAVTADYVADTRSDALTRFHLDRSKSRYVDLSAEFFRIPPRRFLDGEKLLVREVPSKTESGLIAARSTEPLLFPKSVISVVLTDDEYDSEHLLGLLNSRLLYLASLVTGEKMGQDLFPRVSSAQLRGLPIAGTTELTPLVRRLERLAAAHHRLRRIWTRRTQSSNTVVRPLAQVLEDESWTAACSFSRERDGDGPDRNCSTFEVVGGTDDPTVVVRGVDAGVERELLRVEFRRRELQQMVYLSLRALLESRAKVEHLGHVLEKTSVPVGTRDGDASEMRDDDAGGTQDSSTSTTREPGSDADRDEVADAVQTMREVCRTFKCDDGQNPGQVVETADVVQIDDALSAAQMELDAAVFDLYGTTRDEARTVLSVLGIPETALTETLSRLAARRSDADET